MNEQTDKINELKAQFEDLLQIEKLEEPESNKDN